MTPVPDQQPRMKILVLVTEDWFALSHFKPLIRRLVLIGREVVIVTRSSGRLGEIEALGARTIDFAYNRSSMHPLREAATVRRMLTHLRREKPDVIHLIAMKPIVLGGLAGTFARTPHIVIHLTGLGFLAISDSRPARAARFVALAIMRRLLARPGSWLLYENPEDLSFLVAGGVDAGRRTTELGGAGIDPAAYPAVPEPGNAIPVAAFVGRMIRSKGVGVLMQAAALLDERGVKLTIELYGESDTGNPEAIPLQALRSWDDGRHRLYKGHTRDVAAVWRHADIFVLPALSREGMPRALLEAAAAGRPLLVTDVPGCRHFVRDGIEGLIVPPGDADALATALMQLARDPAMRARLGEAARRKVLGRYTEAAVEAAIEQAYGALAAPAGGTTT